MIIALSSIGSGVKDNIDPRFGRAPFFILVDTKNDTVETLINEAAAAGGGAGIATAQMIADRDVKAVITGNVGPNAMRVLCAADIQIFKSAAPSVEQNIALYHKGMLERIVKHGPAHAGGKELS